MLCWTRGVMEVQESSPKPYHSICMYHMILGILKLKNNSGGLCSADIKLKLLGMEERDLTFGNVKFLLNRVQHVDNKPA